MLFCVDKIQLADEGLILDRNSAITRREGENPEPYDAEFREIFIFQPSSTSCCESCPVCRSVFCCAVTISRSGNFCTGKISKLKMQAKTERVRAINDPQAVSNRVIYILMEKNLDDILQLWRLRCSHDLCHHCTVQ